MWETASIGRPRRCRRSPGQKAFCVEPHTEVFTWSATMLVAFFYDLSSALLALLFEAVTAAKVQVYDCPFFCAEL